MFKEVWKKKAHEKNLSREDMLTYCLVKAIRAKEGDKEMLARIFIERAFTAGAVCGHRNHPYQAVREAASKVRYFFKFQNLILGMKAVDLLSDEELDVFASLIEKMRSFPE